MDEDGLRLLARQAERIMQDQLGRKVILYDPTLVAARERSTVVRCAVTGWDGVASVVLKRNDGDDARGFTDWASLAFLSTLEPARGIAPLFYAGDARTRLLVMEDLGGSRSVADLLGHGDATSALRALEALATTMARFVMATAGQEGSYERMRAALPGAVSQGRWREAARWLEARERVTRWADALDIRLPHGFDAACTRVAAVYAEPDAYLAFSHGDPAPSNNHIAADRVRLLDFEYAGYRHALYDITGWNVLCPLPRAWVTAMERSFRRTVGASPVGHALSEDRRYREAWATMCAYRALALFTWLSPDLLARDGMWTPEWTRRAALISTALRLRQACAEVAALAPLAELGGKMAEVLRARCPELGDGAPRWPGVTEAS